MSGQDIKLYYFPSSYFSLKVLLALYEKNAKFNGQIVNLFTGEQNEDWFLKLNYNGEVPVLEIGGEFIAESEDIINVIDSTFTFDPKLAPDMDSDVGKRVNEMRSLLDAVKIDRVTFGALANPSLQVDEITNRLIKNMTRANLAKQLQGMQDDLVKKQRTCPEELKKACDRKIRLLQARMEDVMNESYMREVFDNLEQTFDRMSEELKQSIEDGNEASWLCGPTFTAADITATTLMCQLSMVGMASRYFSRTMRPEVYAYYQRLLQRPSVVKMIDTFNTVESFMKNQIFKSYGKKALKIAGLVVLVAVGYFGFKEYSKIHKGISKC